LFVKCTGLPDGRVGQPPGRRWLAMVDVNKAEQIDGRIRR
jgi:hypothetical protein